MACLNINHLTRSTTFEKSLGVVQPDSDRTHQSTQLHSQNGPFGLQDLVELRLRTVSVGSSKDRKKMSCDTHRNMANRIHANHNESAFTLTHKTQKTKTAHERSHASSHHQALRINSRDVRFIELASFQETVPTKRRDEGDLDGAKSARSNQNAKICTLLLFLSSTSTRPCASTAAT